MMMMPMMLMLEPGTDDDGYDDAVALGRAAQAGRPARVAAAPGGLATQLVARFIITFIIRDGQAPASVGRASREPVSPASPSGLSPVSA